MRKHTRKLGQLGFSVLVVGALGFGATQALASTASRDDCQPCPYPSQTECRNCCFKLNFPDGYCTPVGDCLCY
jgi:hypothetical protein